MLFLLALCEGGDDLAEGRETEIDCFQLLEMLPGHCLIFMDLLTSCQIAEVELAPEQHSSFVSRVTLDQNLEDCVRPRGVNVRSGLSGYPVGLTPLQ